MDSISSINTNQNYVQNISIINKDKKEFTLEINNTESTEKEQDFFEDINPIPHKLIKQEEIELVNYTAKVEAILNSYNEKLLNELKVDQLKQNDFDIKKPFEINNKDYTNYINNNISEQLDNLISSFKESIKLRSDLSIYEQKRNNLLKAKSEGVIIQQSLLTNYDSLINEISKKIGVSSKEYFFDQSNVEKIIKFAENIDLTIKTNLKNNVSIDSIKTNFIEEKNKINEILTTTHTLLESIDRVKKS